MSNNKAGRPAAPDTKNATPEEKAVALLAYTMDRANSFIADAPTTSMVARMGRCARAGVDIAVCEKALDAVQSALDDAREGLKAAYAAPAPKAAVKSRVDLLG